MSEQENAALTEEATLDAQIEEAQAVETVDPVESATTEETKPEVKEDGFQRRINKVTADKYFEKRRADELQQKLDEMQSKPEKMATGAPKLEDFDHDEEAFNAANIKYQVNEAVTASSIEQQKALDKTSADKAQREFNERIVSLGKDDFADVAGAVPQLPVGVADALVNSEKGAELIYHLGTHLDQADKLANMSPQAAMMELGRISANMSATTVKASAAPEPIAPLNSGGSLKQERGPSGATFT